MLKAQLPHYQIYAIIASEKYKNNLELHDVIISVADDLCGISCDEQMKMRYREHKPFNVEQTHLI